MSFWTSFRTGSKADRRRALKGSLAIAQRASAYVRHKSSAGRAVRLSIGSTASACYDRLHCDRPLLDMASRLGSRGCYRLSPDAILP
jgi:hypothetical protein